MSAARRLAEPLARGASLAALLVVAVACYDVKSVELGIEIVPDAEGRVEPRKNELGIGGFWYSYGDRYDSPQACTQIGHHPVETCSLVAWPEPLPSLNFANSGGSMCVFGSVAQILDCELSAEIPCTGPDYSNMWGAGIGLDFALPLAPDAHARHPLEREIWNAREHGVTGVAFDLRLLAGDAPHLRVELPMLLPEGSRLPDNRGSASIDGGPLRLVQPETPGAAFPDEPTPSDEHPAGSPFWGAPAVWSGGNLDVSPVRVGHNEFKLSEVNGPPASAPEAPDSTYAFDVTRLLGIQFHVPPLQGSRLDYGFCISNLTFLRE